jgi:arabinan endo-1,5-alpha-L-arabinosidase
MAKLATFATALLFSCASGPGQAAEAIHVHDPVLIRQGGTYYVFGTGMGIAVHSSTDMRTWREEPPVFERAPEWTFSAVPGFKGYIWAPDISQRDGTYYLYYAVSIGGKITSAIGVATNETLDRTAPAFKWIDRGMVVQSVLNRDLWNAIDPQLIVDEAGTSWLAFGSFWSGLKLVRLQPDRMRFAEPQEWHSIAKRERSVLRADADPEPAAVEAPFIFRRGDYYYLFASWDYCCRGIRSNYKIIIGRSKDVRGPYRDRQRRDLAQGGGSLVLQGNERWPGVGHNSAYTFDGKDYLVFHAYDAHDRGKSKLKILELKWDAAGWPAVDARELSP